MKIIALHAPPKLLAKDASSEVTELRERLEVILHSARDNEEVAAILAEVIFYEVTKRDAHVVESTPRPGDPTPPGAATTRVPDPPDETFTPWSLPDPKDPKPIF